jgi:hypothetical protein
MVIISSRVPTPPTWHMLKNLVDVFSSTISACVMNQSRGHWHLIGALFTTITMSCKLKEELEMNSILNNLVEVAIELGLLASNIKRDVYNVLDVFLSFKKIFDERKTYNLLALMLDQRYKNLRIVFTFVGKELGIAIAKTYDKKTFFPMVLKTHQFLHPLVIFEYVAERTSDEDSNLDIFQMT